MKRMDPALKPSSACAFGCYVATFVLYGAYLAWVAIPAHWTRLTPSSEPHHQYHLQQPPPSQQEQQWSSLISLMSRTFFSFSSSSPSSSSPSFPSSLFVVLPMPDKYWAIALPIWCCVVIVCIFLAYIAANLISNPPLHSRQTMYLTSDPNDSRQPSGQWQAQGKQPSTTSAVGAEISIERPSSARFRSSRTRRKQIDIGAFFGQGAEKKRGGNSGGGDGGSGGDGDGRGKDERVVPDFCDIDARDVCAHLYQKR